MATIPLPSTVTDFVGQQVMWAEDKVVLTNGEATLVPTGDIGLVLGARWARYPGRNEPFGHTVGLVQYLMERPDGTSRWTFPVDVE